eukprot:CAMPEP_0204857370 /NCGR_PEP_ID=MMETSP1347-20130617/20634_1 /ASSEMBLY_ACC=CAM_ASM_000690 /TAXON_ID=215587 /ORGANISM="Aplanochytrium stocchinoi, Strain GSBS06" /LENGTH=342 /DNA_ID=CAMNT_0052004747 /DNA_START=192 /DNA_END=1220 /DNA_ORIENTATION=-
MTTSEPDSKKPKTGASAHTAMDEVSHDGTFVRTETVFRNKISNEQGSKFPAEKGRYHLYVSYACPWASRCLAVRALKGLEDVISLSVVSAVFAKTKPEDEADTHKGWVFVRKDEEADAIPDTVMGAKTIRELYELNNDTLGKYTVPILFDKKQKVIVNNESAEIIRILNCEFNGYAKNPDVDLYPEALRKKIDETNEWVYPHINNGVYRCGFAQKQKAYDIAVKGLFEHLEKAEKILSDQRYLTSNTQITEADIRFFVTIVRFDEVYHGHFKCNKKKISDYPAITGHMREIYQLPGMAETVNMTHIKEHYHRSHPTINPFGIVPIGPNVLETLSFPHGRDKM